MTTMKVREENANFDLLISDNMPEFFTDGVSQFLMGYPISKLTFHSVMTTLDSDEVEQRKGVLNLTMSTPVLLEFCKNVLFSAQSSVNEFSEGGKKVDANMRKIMEGVTISMPASEPYKKKK